jgi:rifampicin phosphotransferase
MIWKFSELPESAHTYVGGKARVLARLTQMGYPIPDGFVITSSAFHNGELRPDAWKQVAEEVSSLRRHNGHSTLAVRSSAIEEDSETASFAGQFETILNLKTDDEVRRAIHAVYHSRYSARVTAYAQAQSLGAGQEMAVIVQEMIPAALAGVLFTVDPVTGNQTRMAGNYVHGLGEQLVSGEVTAGVFTLDKVTGVYDGPAEMKPYAEELLQLGRRLSRDLKGDQDLEWAVADGRVSLLQSRPVTTMGPYDPATGEWNDSRRGDYLWSRANFGEAIPDVMTPITWSLIQIYAEETFGDPLPGDNPLMGNIGGRFYVNLSLFASFMHTLGFSRERMSIESEEFFGNLPEDIDIPMIPFSRVAVLRRFVPFALKAVIRRARNLRRLDEFTTALPDRIVPLSASIQETQSPASLARLWQDEIEPLLRRAYRMLQAGTSEYENAYRPLRRKLAGQVGEDGANILLSGVSNGKDQLASLGPLFGLWQVAAGELSRADYMNRFGHRSPQEFEIFIPRPREEAGWMERQLEILGEADIPALLARREAEKQAAWQRYTRDYPGQVTRTGKGLTDAAAAARRREAIRSEVVRLFELVRLFVRRAGELSGLGEDVFFLWLEELLPVLYGKPAPHARIQVRRQAHERLSSLPSYPALIVGRFDPYSWAADPDRRTDLFDSRAVSRPHSPANSADKICGLPGSVGVAEGKVRVLEDVEEGPSLLPGEVLVAATTNVGWTPLFPRAAAVVTDVGAPLSHAAIVARELGIPAVIGTGDATMRLKTGDRVRVDGARGTVEWLDVQAIGGQED